MVNRIFVALVLCYFIYSLSVYCYGSKPTQKPPEDVLTGLSIWQSYNCQSCHQLYGLGGYMGPDLTNIISDPIKGKAYTYAFIKNGTPRMPDFKLSDDEVHKLIAFLSWTDKSGKSRIPADKVTSTGNYKLEN